MRYSDWKKQEDERHTKGSGEFSTKFLKDYLRKDGDSVLVRFPEEFIRDLDFVNVHPKVELGDNSYRDVACIRDSNQPTHNCPLCASDTKRATRVYLKMIAYIPNEQTGQMDIVPCIWDRSGKFGGKICDVYNEWGNIVYKIKRTGNTFNDTEYDVMPTNTSVYTEAAYPSDFSSIANVNPKKVYLLEKTFEELTQFATTKVMPMPPKKTNNTSNNEVPHNTPTYNANPQNAVPQGGYDWQRGNVAPQPTPQVAPMPTYNQAEVNPFPNAQNVNAPMGNPYPNPQPTQAVNYNTNYGGVPNPTPTYPTPNTPQYNGQGANPGVLQNTQMQENPQTQENTPTPPRTPRKFY